MGIPEIVEVLLSDVGTVALLLTILIAGFRRYWVFGWTYESAVKDRNEWRRIALSTGRVADRAVSRLDEQESEGPPFREPDRDVRERGRW